MEQHGKLRWTKIGTLEIWGSQNHKFSPLAKTPHYAGKHNAPFKGAKIDAFLVLA